MRPAQGCAVDRESIRRVAGFMKRARSVLFITGAGISADSGLPTYRGIGGLYNDSVTDEGIPIETALAGRTLASHPEVTWKYLARIEERCRNARYNRAHEVIALAQERFERVCVLTQNIDGFHQAAGSRNVIDIHGDLHDIFCPACGWRTKVKDYSGMRIPPGCPRCGSIARPDVVFFGEMLPARKYDDLIRQLGEGFDLYFSVGTTSVFAYIAEPVIEAKALGRPSVEINPADTAVSDYVDVRLRMGAAAALDAIWSCYDTEMPRV